MWLGLSVFFLSAELSTYNAIYWDVLYLKHAKPRLKALYMFYTSWTVFGKVFGLFLNTINWQPSLSRLWRHFDATALILGLGFCLKKAINIELFAIKGNKWTQGLLPFFLQKPLVARLPAHREK